MWAPADIFTPTVNAVGLALERAFTLAWNNWPIVLIAVVVLILLLVAVGQVRRQSRG